jgi:DNA mismatch endonuclease (patch repair protein)
MHKCKKFVLPSSNTDFWFEKLSQNKKRDKKNYAKLKKIGWNYIIIWECQLSEKREKTLAKVNNILSRLINRKA